MSGNSREKTSTSKFPEAVDQVHFLAVLGLRAWSLVGCPVGATLNF